MPPASGSSGPYLAETRFGVARVGALWTVVEHGPLDADPAAVHDLLVRAASDAVVRHSRAVGQEPAPPEELARHLFADARSYTCLAGNMVPAFVQRAVPVVS